MFSFGIRQQMRPSPAHGQYFMRRLLGPWYGVAVALLPACCVILLGLGSLMAFQAAVRCLVMGLVYDRFRNSIPTLCAESIPAPGIIGGLLAWPVAVLHGKTSRKHRLLRLCGAIPGIHHRRSPDRRSRSSDS